MNKLMLSLLVFICFCLPCRVKTLIPSEISMPVVNQVLADSKVQRFERNEYHFLGLKRLEKYHPLPEDAKYYLDGAEKAFFGLFSTVDRDCTWKGDDDSKQNLKYFADKQFEKFKKRGPFEKIIITDGKKEFDFISYVYTLDLFFYYGMLPLDMNVVIDDACVEIGEFLHKAAEALMISGKLFTPLFNEHKRQIIDAFCSNGVNISDVKFINFGSGLSEEEKAWRKRENLERFSQLGMQLPVGLFAQRDGTLEEGVLDSSSVLSRFLEVLFPGTPCKRSEGKTTYNVLLDYLEINLGRPGLRHTLFDFPGACSDVYGRYLVDPEMIGLSCFEPFFHEGMHALSEPFTAIFEILEGTNVGKESSTMRAASCFFDSSETKLFRNSLGILSRLEKDKNVILEHPVRQFEVRGMSVQQAYEYMLRSEEKENYFPSNLCDFPKFLQEYADSKPKLAKFLFGDDREVMQILGIRVYDDVLYVNELSDFALYVEQKLPIRADHLVERRGQFGGEQDLRYSSREKRGQNQKMGKMLMLSKDFSYLSKDAFLSMVETVLLNMVKQPENFIHYNLKMNRDFMALLFKLYGLNITDYEREMRGKMAKVNIGNGDF